MGKIASELISEIDMLLRDRNPGSKSISLFEKYVALQRRMIVLASMMHMDDLWVSGFLELTNSKDTYDIETQQELQYIKLLRRRSDGFPIKVVSHSEFEDARVGDTVPAKATPQIARFIDLKSKESQDEAKQLQFWPWPDRTYIVDAMLSWFPSESMGMNSEYVVPFDNHGCMALIHDVAADLFGLLDDQEIARRKLQNKDRTEWLATSMKMIHASNVRRNMMQGGGRVRHRRRW